MNPTDFLTQMEIHDGREGAFFRRKKFGQIFFSKSILGHLDYKRKVFTKNNFHPKTYWIKKKNSVNFRFKIYLRSFLDRFFVYLPEKS